MRYSMFLYLSIISLFLLPLGSKWIIAQNLPDSQFRSPLDIPLRLSGNFGEIRSNHFHSGLDFKTNGQSGLPVYSTAGGYVSRIKIEPGGYGKAVYIQHPNGHTSLYGHLQNFRADIAERVKEEQYKRERFSVDIFLPAGEFNVAQGEYIALSGNSGSSEAPHLHFEIRETDNQHPINPLLYPFEVTDTRPPRLDAIHLYSLTGRKDLKQPLKIPLTGYNGSFQPRLNQQYPIDQIGGIGIQGIDFLDDSNNKCGIYKIDLYLDEALFFRCKIDEFSFSESLYINSLIDYRQYRTDRTQVIKTFKEPNNSLSIYDFIKNFGTIEIKDQELHEVKIAVYDVHGNKSEAQFQIYLDPSAYEEQLLGLPFYSAYLSYEEPNVFEEDGIRIAFQTRSFYDNLYFLYQQDSTPSGAYAPIHQIHQAETALHKSFKLALKAYNLPDELKPFATIVRASDEGFSAVGGHWEDGYLVTNTRSFGNYTIMLDSLAPSIRYSGRLHEGIQPAGNQITFIITDDFSGIQSYRGTLNNQWMLFEWDPKSSKLSYKTDPERFPPGTVKELKLMVTDAVGNVATFVKEFSR